MIEKNDREKGNRKIEVELYEAKIRETKEGLYTLTNL